MSYSTLFVCVLLSVRLVFILYVMTLGILQATKALAAKFVALLGMLTVSSLQHEEKISIINELHVERLRQTH